MSDGEPAWAAPVAPHWRNKRCGALQKVKRRWGDRAVRCGGPMSQKRLPRAAPAAPPVGSAPPDLSRLSVAAVGEGFLTEERRAKLRKEKMRVRIPDAREDREVHPSGDNEKDDQTPQKPPKPVEDETEPYAHRGPPRTRYDWFRRDEETPGNVRVKEREKWWEENHLACHHAYGTSAEERFAQTIGFLTNIYDNEGYMCNCNYDPVSVVPHGYTKDDVHAAGFFTERHYNEFMLQQLFCHKGPTGTYAAPEGSVTGFVQQELAKVDLFKKDYEAIKRRIESSAGLGSFDAVRFAQMLSGSGATVAASMFFTNPLAGGLVAALLAAAWGIGALRPHADEAEENARSYYEKEKRETAEATRNSMADFFNELAKDPERLQIANELWVAHKTRVHAAIFSMPYNGLAELVGRKEFDQIVILKPAGYEHDDPYVFEPNQELLPDVPGGVGPADPTSLQPAVQQLQTARDTSDRKKADNLTIRPRRR